MASKVKCAFCKSYTPKDEAILVGLQSFCSLDHMAAYQEKTSLKTDKPLKAKKPMAKKPGVPTDPEKHEATLKRDRYRCAVCGGTHNLHVHHIRYRSEIAIKDGRDELWNLITLCNTHHELVHSDKKVWQPVLIVAAEQRNAGKLTPVMTLKKRLDRDGS